MIEVACGSCGKTFELADKWVGKAFKCPKCAQPVRVPAGPADDAPAEDASDSQLNWDLISTNAESMAGKTTLGAEPKARESLIEPLPERAGGPRQDAGPSLLPTLPGKGKRPRSGGYKRSRGGGTRYGGEDFSDGLASFLLLGGVLSILAVPIMTWIAVPDTRQNWPLELVRIIFGSIALVMVVVPITGIGMRLASRAMKFDLPYDTGYRLLAWMLSPSFFMAIGGLIAWQVNGVGQYPAGLLSGALTGLGLSFFILWWLFSLGFGQAIVSFISTVVFMVLGGIVGGVLVGVIALLLSPLLLSLMGKQPPEEPDRTAQQQVDRPVSRGQGDPPPPVEVEPEDYFDRAIYRLNHARHTKRYAGAKMLADADRNEQRADEVVNALLARMYDPDPLVKRTVFQALRIWDQPHCLGYAQELANTTDTQLRRLVLEVLVEYGDEQAIPLFARQLKANPRDTAAKDALIGYGLEAQSHVLEHLDDTNSTVRLAMLEVLYEVADADAADRILPLVADRDSDVVSLARKTLSRIAPGRFDAADEALTIIEQARFSSDRSRAYHLLADHPPKPNDPRRTRVAEALEKVFDDHSIRSNDRSAVIRAIGRWHRPETVSKLLTYIDEERDWSTRRNNAIEALGEIGNPNAIKPIINWISKEPTLVANTLVKFGQAAEPQLIVAIYQVRSEKGLLAAVEVLDKVGTGKCLTHLYKLSRSAKYQSVRLAAGMAHKAKLEQIKAEKQEQRQQEPQGG